MKLDITDVKSLIKKGFSGGVSSLMSKPRVQRLLFNTIRLNKSEFSELWMQEEVRFLTYVFAMRHKSKSQILQDLWVCFELEEKKNGFFVEFGATNGLKNSNTWLLEKEFGWKGILAEPNPFWHADLAANRSVPIEHRCVTSRSGELVAFAVTDNTDPELSGLASVTAADHFALQRASGSVIEVETISFNDLLSKYGAPREIDYLSIDTEGSEVDVIDSINFSEYSFKLISVEQNKSNAQYIQDRLGQNGLVRVFDSFSQWDAWYVSADLKMNRKFEFYSPEA